MWLSCISSEALRLQRGCGCLVSQVRHWDYREDVVVLYLKWGTEITERMWLSCISSEALRLQRGCGCLVSQVRHWDYREDVVVLYLKWGTETTERMWLSCISSEAEVTERMWLSCISSEALRLQRGCGCLVSQVRHWDYREDVVVLYLKWGAEITERMWLSCISSEALRLQRCGCLVFQVRQFSIWFFSSTNKLVCYTVLEIEMKIWNYWSESNSWIYFYIILNKNWKKLLVQTKFYWSSADGPVYIVRTGYIMSKKFMKHELFFSVI